MASKTKKPPTIPVDQNSPAMIRGAIAMVIRSAVNLWTWHAVLSTKELPEPTSYWVYPRDLELGGPDQMAGKRVKVTFEVEEI